jgi:hypothetical protein
MAEGSDIQRGRRLLDYMPASPSECAMAWRYLIEHVTIAERWGSKRQAAEIALFQERLNALGAQDWEMVGFETVPLTGAFSANIKGYIYLVFFKQAA